MATGVPAAPSGYEGPRDRYVAATGCVCGGHVQSSVRSATTSGAGPWADVDQPDEPGEAVTTVPTQRIGSQVLPLLRAAHIGPTVAVTTVVALLAVGQDLPAARGVVVTAAVFAGQLTIGWGNDLVDAPRDHQVGRTDKPLATGELRASTVAACLAVAAVACVVLSFLVGWRSGLVHLGLGVASGHAYNLWLKRTPWSWLPYAVAFGTLPAVVTLAELPHHWPPALDDGDRGRSRRRRRTSSTRCPISSADEATGVRGLPHRLGAGASRVAAIVLLVAASVVAVLGPAGTPDAWAWGALVVVLGLAVVAYVGRGRTPFQAAIAIALVDVLLLHGGDRMTTWDLAVVGAGPAGAAAAIGALGVDPSLRVALLDRATFPRDKACGDGIAPQVLDLLDEAGVTSVVADRQGVTRLSLRRGDLQVERPMARTAWVVPRAEFDHRLVTAAQAAGADLLHERVREVREGPLVRLDDRHQARVVVGADGAHSVVRRTAGPAPGPLAVALRGYAPTPPDRAGGQAIVFDTAGPPAYAWSFDRGDGLSNVGYGVLVGRRGAGLTKAQMLERLDALLPGASTGGTDWKGHQLPLSAGPWRPSRGRVLLAGDAAGLVNPMTGEGIYYAVATGLAAGRAAAQAVADGVPASAGRRYAARRAPAARPPPAACPARRLAVPARPARRRRAARLGGRAARLRRPGRARARPRPDHPGPGPGPGRELARELTGRPGRRTTTSPTQTRHEERASCES